ncbi:MAG: hypothetical protein SPJ01_05060 [Butyricicoccus sp.]|nr:hypothetical protein [Butyricicoccus sp.]
MDHERRFAAFEQMLAAVQADYVSTVHKMTQLKAAGKEKTVTYRQLLGNKLSLQNILTMYQIYGLIDDWKSEPQGRENR